MAPGHLERRAGDGATGQGVLQHVKIHTLGPRVDAQLVQVFHGEATVLGQRQGLRLGGLRRHIRDHGCLLVAIETQGLLLTLKRALGHLARLPAHPGSAT
jgi:hypothetical protein